MSASLTAGQPFWTTKDGIPGSYIQLERSLDVDVVILGAGISGALIAHSFAKEGLRVAVVDKRRIAHGSTSASTALLQYEIDTPLSKLKDMIGKDEAERAYELCGQAIKKVGKVARTYHEQCTFREVPSIYLAAGKKDVAFLKKEFKARKDAGFEVRWLTKRELKSQYGIAAQAAIRSELGGQLDPYALTHSILHELQEEGHFVFERTEMDIGTMRTEDGVRIVSDTGHAITARKLVFATGYESQEFLKEKIVTLKSSYAFVTEKIGDGEVWKDSALLWDTSDPYIYARTTQDNRILIGGGDIVARNMFVRNLLMPWRIRRLLRDFRSYMPRDDLKIAFAWTGTFGETKDGLAYIGESPEWKNCYFALGFGGNGITYSALAGDFLVGLYRGERPKDLELFRFGR